MTPARIARFLGLVGLAAFLGLAARTSTATPAFEDDQAPPPPPTIGGASLLKDPKPVLVSRVDAFPFSQDAPEPAKASPPDAPDELIPPHEPAAEGPGDLGVPALPDIPPPPAMDSQPKAKDETKPTKEAAPEVVPAPLAPAPLAPAESADDAPPIAPDFTGDDFPGITPTPEPLSIDPAKAPKPVVDDLMTAPAPARVERPKAWRAEREGAPARGPVDVAVEIDEVPAVVSSDPDAQARSFVERNQREAEARLKALQGEAEELRGRLTKLEAAIQQWQNLADAMKKAQGPAAVKAEAPQPKPAASDAPTPPEAAASLEPQPAPRQAALVVEPHAARAQDVPAPPLR